LVGADRFIEVDPQQLSPKDETAAAQIIRMLVERGVIRGGAGDEVRGVGDGI
jgi:hypothetical protein